MSIRESAYMEMMKNCSKFNSRISAERMSRYPVFDQQTGTAHRPSMYLWRKPEQRYPSNNPDYVCMYPAIKWRKNTSAAPSDSTEMKMFMHHNPALSDAINNGATPGERSAHIPNNDMEWTGASGENTTDTPTMSSSSAGERRMAAQFKRQFDDFDDDVDDMNSEGPDSDDDFGSKKKRKRGEGSATRGKKRTVVGRTKAEKADKHEREHKMAEKVDATTMDEKRHVCTKCGARYKSRPGLSYHKAHVHGDGVTTSVSSLLGDSTLPPLTIDKTPSKSNTSSSCSSPAVIPPPVIFSPSVDISDTCDLCEGTRLECKKINKPEELVTCHDCGRSAHPSCLNFTDNMKLSTSKFGWQCIECKSCSICGTSENDDKLLFCDDCDRGFHLYCLKPALDKAPEGSWSCHLCVKVFGDKAAAKKADK